MNWKEKGWDWTIPQNANGNYAVESASLSVLKDIRDELQSLNRLLHCYNCIDIPKKLDKIVKNTAKNKQKVAR